MEKAKKDERLKEIKKLVVSFCGEHLNEELQSYALKLCDTLGRKRKISITSGKKEIWAASIIYVIARLNFLFDSENELFLSADTVCDFFETKKSTVGNKATQIEKACKLGFGAEGFCSPEISDAMTLVELPSGFVIPKSMLPDYKIVYESADDEESREIEQRRKGHDAQKSIERLPRIRKRRKRRRTGN